MPRAEDSLKTRAPFGAAVGWAAVGLAAVGLAAADEAAVVPGTDAVGGAAAVSPPVVATAVIDTAGTGSLGRRGSHKGMVSSTPPTSAPQAATAVTRFTTVSRPAAAKGTGLFSASPARSRIRS